MEKELTDQELVEQTAKEYELDVEDDKDRIGKIVQLKKDRFVATKQKNKTKEATDQHSKGREFYKGILKKRGLDPRTGEPVKKDDKKGDPKKNDNDVGKLVQNETQRALGRDKLERMGLDDDTVQEIIDYADWKKISINEALKKSTIKTVIDRFNDKKDTKKSSITNKHRSSDGKDTTTYNFDKLKDMPEAEMRKYIADLDTESEEYAQFEKWYAKQ